MNTAQCMKCKKQMAWKGHPKLGKTVRNGFGLAGKCSKCGCKMVRMISKNDIQSGSGLLGKLLGLKDGKIPILSSIPLIGALF